MRVNESLISKCNKLLLIMSWQLLNSCCSGNFLVYNSRTLDEMHTDKYSEVQVL